MKNRKTKTGEVLKHLHEKRYITSWEAIQKYGATRLSAIIFNLRERGHNIKTHSIQEKDRNGNSMTFAKYELM